MTRDLPSTDRALVALGFAAGEHGVLVVLVDSVVTLTPAGRFYEIRVTLGNGNAVTAVLSKSALKFSRVGAKL